MTQKPKDKQNIQQYLEENQSQGKYRSTFSEHRKSYVCDTFSSLEKKKTRNQALLLGEEEQEGEE